MIMIELMIKEKGEHGKLVLQEKSGKLHSLIFEFYDIENKPEVGDTLVMDEELLDRNSEAFAQPYAFGAMDSKYGRKESELDESELLGLQTKNGNIVLKRIYG